MRDVFARKENLPQRREGTKYRINTKIFVSSCLGGRTFFEHQSKDQIMSVLSRENLIQFQPKHSCFVGFDSDGCVFDSMELKHKECFIPNIIKYYNLQPVSKYAREAAEFVNLYSYWRGANRFPALIKTMELLKERPEVRQRGVTIPDLTPIQRFIDSAPTLGNPALKEAIAKTDDSVLKHLLAWSEAVNRDIESMVKGLPPFPLVEESLEKLVGKADMMVVSATPAEALCREWEEHGIDKYMSVIAGQEIGKKEEQLGLTVQGKYPPDHILMIGDAFGDLKAARAVGALFYPIVPGREEQSWKIFDDRIIELFLNGKYTEQIESEFLKDFEKALPKTPPWRA
jgi:phosphoglycolate phosphatase-like HAD superfamily hydrolase